MRTKVFVIMDGPEYMDILVEDGGIASIHHNGEVFLTTYYQERLSAQQIKRHDTTSIDGKSNVRTWAQGKHINFKMILDAISWLTGEGYVYQHNYDIIFTDVDRACEEIETKLLKHVNKTKNQFMQYYYNEYAKLEQELEKVEDSKDAIQTDEQEIEFNDKKKEIYQQMRELDRELYAYELYEKPKS